MATWQRSSRSDCACGHSAPTTSRRSSRIAGSRKSRSTSRGIRRTRWSTPSGFSPPNEASSSAHRARGCSWPRSTDAAGPSAATAPFASSRTSPGPPRSASPSRRHIRDPDLRPRRLRPSSTSCSRSTASIVCTPRPTTATVPSTGSSNAWGSAARPLRRGRLVQGGVVDPARLRRPATRMAASRLTRVRECVLPSGGLRARAVDRLGVPVRRASRRTGRLSAGRATRLRLAASDEPSARPATDTRQVEECGSGSRVSLRPVSCPDPGSIRSERAFVELTGHWDQVATPLASTRDTSRPSARVLSERP